tara:strand:+ start:1898 stop:2569 length:672 start_codon:yes stop_codon:yes gene_type:complete
MIGDNIFQQSQDAQQTAAGVYNQMATNPQGLSPTAYQQFMNPFTQDVINRGQQDLMRQEQMAVNNLDAQADAANAFGGSRHGIARGLLGGEYARLGGDLAAQQRQSGYNQSQNLAMQDFNNQQNQMRTGASGLTGLSNQMFGQGNIGLQQQQRASQLAQQQQQMLLDAARNQTLANLGYPRENLNYYNSIFGGLPSFNPMSKERMGLFDVLTAAGSLPPLPFG